MRLTELFTGKTNNQNSSQTGKLQSAGNMADVNRQIRSFVPGQTISGEIVGRNGNEVQIRLSDELVLNARIDQNINLELGKNLTFEIKSNGNTLMLSPLFTNVATDVNVLKALDMAGLPVNNNTIKMTGQMMEAGLSVNRTALQQIYREINSFPEADVADIVNLHKLQLPVTEENVSQMASYRNLTYQLTDAMGTVLELIPGAVSDMLSEGNLQGAVGLYQELFLAVMENGEGNPQMSLDGEALVHLQPGQDMPEEGLQQGLLAENAGKEMQAAADLLTDGMAQENHTGTQNHAVMHPEAAMPENPSGQEMSIPEQTRTELAQQFSQVLEELNLTPEENRMFAAQLKEFAQGTAGSEQLFALAEKLLQAAGHSGQERKVMQEVFGTKAFQNLLTERLRSLWTIRPEEVGTPEKVNEVYRRISRQLSSLAQALDAGGQSGSGAFRAVANMSQNIDFLQQLNQMYAYVQLPLRMQQGETHGDLYVYANRKNLASREGQVSALLHLDMENLGPVDVYVAMQSAKVTTQFYVQDEETLDFLEGHMDLLTERLKKRGYDCGFSMSIRRKDNEQAGNKGLHPILEQDRGILLSQYAFDVRT